MAQRRMFSKTIIESDTFLDLPVSSRELYFQLGMYADDDGFVSPKKVIRTVGASEDDLKVLLAKHFLIPFDSGVIVIRHWGLNNYIAKDRYTPTTYIEEYKKALTDNVYKMYTEKQQLVHAGKVSIGKESKEENTISSFKKRKRTTYKKTGEEMRFSANKWWVIPKHGGDWLEFADKTDQILTELV